MKNSKKATPDDYTAVEFEPWQHEDGQWKPPSNVEWNALANPCLITLRLAWITMFKTKEEVMETLDNLDEETGSDLMRGFQSTLDFFKGAVMLLEGAEARILCAGSALIKRDEETRT